MRHILIILILSGMAASVDGQLPCDNDTTGYVALVDLKSDYFMDGYQGGLYPGGENEMPATHRLAGSKVVKNIKPLDTLGNVDLINGKIVFLGLGASTAGNTWNNFKGLVEDEPGLNPCLQLVNGSQGAKGLDVMIDTLNYPWYWTDMVFTKMSAQGATPIQVQAIWLRTASKTDTIVEFPLFPNGIADKLEILLPILLDKFPNLKQVYISGFFYGGYADSSKAFYDIVAEPGSYYTNYAVKWVVERQINGDPDLVYAGPGKKAPWVAWGPHTWADGMRPNEHDGLYWDCEVDFQADGGGYHLTNTGKLKDAQLLLDWAKNAPTIKKWFLDNPGWASCDPSARMGNGEAIGDNEMPLRDAPEIFPQPNRGVFQVRMPLSEQTSFNLKLIDSSGRLIWSGNQVASGSTITVAPEGPGLTAGIYYLQCGSPESITTLPVLVQ